MNERPHKRLLVWQRSVDFVTSIYQATARFPGTEQFGLTSQIRRAAISVPSNIAEGLTRTSTRDKLHFLNIAKASLSELDTLLEITSRTGLIAGEKMEMLESDVILIQRLLNGLINKIRLSW